MSGAVWVDGVLTYPPLSDPAWWEYVPEIRWLGSVELLPWEFVCGFCGNKVSSNRGMVGIPGSMTASLPVSELYVRMAAYICPHCDRVTFREGTMGGIPGPIYGEKINNLPDRVAAIYEEARKSMQVGAYTGAIGLCRILLTHVVDLEGGGKKTFKESIDWLDAEGHIPKKAKSGLEWIRAKGNEATHDMIVFNEAEASRVMAFTAQMLLNIYDFPARVPVPPNNP